MTPASVLGTNLYRQSFKSIAQAMTYSTEYLMADSYATGFRICCTIFGITIIDCTSMYQSLLQNCMACSAASQALQSQRLLVEMTVD